MDAIAASDIRRHGSIVADDDATRPAGAVKGLMPRKARRRDDAIGQVNVVSPSCLGHIDDEPQMMALAEGLDEGKSRTFPVTLEA